MKCDHEWDQVNEEFLLGGFYPIGWKCRLCDEFVDRAGVGPEGLPGKRSGRHILYAPHGAVGRTASGKPYRRQIIGPDGTLTVEEA